MVVNNSSDVCGSHDGAEPNPASSRYLQLEQCSELRGRQDKGTGRSRVQPERVRQSDIQVNPISVQGDRIVVSNYEVGSQKQDYESSVDVLSMGVESIFANGNPSPDDEDVCPTCLEGVVLCL